MGHTRLLAGRLLVAVALLLGLTQPLGPMGAWRSHPASPSGIRADALGPVASSAILATGRSELHRRPAGGREQHRATAFEGLALSSTRLALVAVLLLWLAALAGTVHFLGSSSRRTTLSRAPPPLPVT